MNDQTVQDLMAKLDVFSAKVGVAADQLWAVMVKQAYLSAITDLVTGIVMILSSVVFFTLLFKKNLVSKIKEEFTSEGLVVVLSIIFFACLGLGGLVTLLPVSELVTPIFNPEYWAYTHILDALK